MAGKRARVDDADDVQLESGNYGKMLTVERVVDRRGDLFLVRWLDFEFVHSL